MIVVAGGDLVLPDRVLRSGAVTVDGNRIVDVGPARRPSGATIIDATGCHVVPGFVDGHVHGVLGCDTLDGTGAVAAIARALPRFGVTAFAPTTMACPPGALRAFLQQVREASLVPDPYAARVAPAHLESNFVNPDYRGAQPIDCLRLPPAASAAVPPEPALADYDGAEILDVIRTYRAEVGAITLAPELRGGLDLVRALVASGHRVSLGHSGASFEVAMAAMDAGARRATHLFNRMAPLAHRAPGLAGAVLVRDDVVAELICDGHHVHPAMASVAIAAKGAGGLMAITDGTAGSGLAPGAAARLGGQAIRVRGAAAFLDDGTLAGSTATMDRVFRTIVTVFGRSVVEAAVMCATTPARELGLDGRGVIEPGAIADLVTLDSGFRVRHTLIGGVPVYAA